MSGGHPASDPPAGGAPTGRLTPGLKRFRADLHIHTALSPCGSDEMTPAAIVAAASARGLDMIAVCDHNTAGNVLAVQQAGEAAGGGLAVIAGMELTSAEEVHVVGLFPDAAAAERAAARVRSLLPQADPDYYSFFGEQPLLGGGRARGGVGDRRPGAGHSSGSDGGGSAHPQRRRAGRGGARGPEIVRRLLAAGFLPRRRRLRRARGVQVAARGFAAARRASRLPAFPL